MTESRLAEAAAAQLRANGYIVETDARISLGNSGHDIRADVVARSATENGELVADVVVETKSEIRKLSSSALVALSRVASVFGARRAFLFDGDWFEADPSFVKATPAVCPNPLPGRATVVVPRDLLTHEIEKARELLRSTGRAETWDIIDLISRDAANRSDLIRTALKSNIGALTLAQLLAATSNGKGPTDLPPTLARAMAHLLEPNDNWSLLDPNCFLGANLWAASEIAGSNGKRLQLRANLSARSERLQKSFGQLAGLAGASVTSDVKNLRELTESTEEVDAVVTMLPPGLKVAEPISLSTGDSTTNAQLILLDSITRWLKPGGRAVLAAGAGVFFDASKAAVHLRDKIANSMRVVAVIELPPKILPTTGLRLGIVVLQNTSPTETLIARLAGDWEEQLSPNGNFFRAYVARLRGVA